MRFQRERGCGISCSSATAAACTKRSVASPSDVSTTASGSTCASGLTASPCRDGCSPPRTRTPNAASAPSNLLRATAAMLPSVPSSSASAAITSFAVSLTTTTIRLLDLDVAACRR